MNIISIKTESSSEFDVEYCFSWDFEIARIKKEDKILVKECLESIKALNIDWLPNGFTLGFIKMEKGDLAVYIDGTSSQPHLGIDLNQLKKLCLKDGLNFKKQIFISICHELYHAYQEMNEQEYDCDEAESFAVGTYFDYKMAFKKTVA